MKRTISATFIMIALSAFIWGQTPTRKSDKEEQAKNEVIALANSYHDALVKRDAAAMELILADSYVDISANGMPTTKFLMLRMCRELPPNAPRLESIDLDENFTIVRVYGETALLVTKVTLKWQGSDEELNQKWKLMPKGDTFMMTLAAVKKNGVWQVVSTHESEYEKPRISEPKS